LPLPIATVHLPTKFGADIFIYCGAEILAFYDIPDGYLPGILDLLGDHIGPAIHGAYLL